MSAAIGIAIVAGLGVAFWALAREVAGTTKTAPPAEVESSPYRSRANDGPARIVGWESDAMLRLDDPRWASVRTAWRDGIGDDLPRVLRAIAAEPDGSAAYEELLRFCVGGGTLAEAGFAVAPHLVAMAERSTSPSLLLHTLAIAGLSRRARRADVAPDLARWCDAACDRARAWPPQRYPKDAHLAEALAGLSLLHDAGSPFRTLLEKRGVQVEIVCPACHAGGTISFRAEDVAWESPKRFTVEPTSVPSTNALAKRAVVGQPPSDDDVAGVLVRTALAVKQRKVGRVVAMALGTVPCPYCDEPFRLTDAIRATADA